MANVDALSKDELAIVVAALELKRASVARAAKSEHNAKIVELRSVELAAIDALVRKFR